MKARTWKHNFVNMIGMTHEYGILEGLSSEVVIILVVVLCYLGLFSFFAKFMTVVPIQRNNCMFETLLLGYHLAPPPPR
jgi:hypothetical protein